MSQYIISILLPVKNAEPYLNQCIESILTQTESNWELIAVDDHSTDSSHSILTSYAEKENRITVLRNNGYGIINALRKAYQHSKGELITRMDADDIMLHQKLLLLKEILLKAGNGHIATGLVQYFSKNTLGDGYLKYQNWLNDLSRTNENFKDIYKECVIPSPSWMAFRTDLDAAGAFNANTYPEDYDLCFRFYEQGLIIKAVDRVIHQWRDYAERTSRNDPNYADVHFFDLKMHYFLKLDYKKNRPLVLWGAGRKGKQIAKALKKESIKFEWITDNIQKIGHDIYGVILKPEAFLKKIDHPIIIISIAAPEALPGIQKKLDALSLKRGSDYYFFC